MPLHGSIKTSFSRFSYITISVFIIVFSLFVTLNPKAALADFVLRGSTCFFRYGNTSGQTQELPVDIRFCTGGGSANACHDIEVGGGGECITANVPGSSGTNCGAREMSVSYRFNNGDNNPPTHILFDAGCTETWSRSGEGADDLNIEYFSVKEGKYEGLRFDSRYDSDEFKIDNGNDTVTIPLYKMKEELQDYTTEKRFIFYPNCGGREDSMDADCYRKEDLDPWIPPPPPPCIMPPEDISYTTSCTPTSWHFPPEQRTTDVIRARNLNLGVVNGVDYCKVDYVNVSLVQNPPYPQYWNSATNGVAEKPIPQGFTYRGDGSNLILQPGQSYWISYYHLPDAASPNGQLSAGKLFTMRGSCPTAAAPTISQLPQCRFSFPYDTEPERDKIYLRWGDSPNPGQGFVGYEIQVDDNSSFSSPVSYAKYAGDTKELPFGAPAYSTTIPIGSTQYYRIRGENWGGYGGWSTTRSYFMQRKPAPVGSFNATAYPKSGTATNATANITWSYPNDPVYAVNTTSSGFILRRAGGPGANIARGISYTARSYTDTSLLTCNNTDYTYSINGVNNCGTGNLVSDTTNCPANRPPTCTIQYLNGTSWQNFPAGGVTRDKSTTMQVRNSCSDPEGNPITYSWTTTCGSVSPSNAATTTYRFPGTAGVSCDIRSVATDSLNASAQPVTGRANTNPTAGITSLTLAPDSRSIQRSSTADAYAVISGVTQNLATMKYTVTGYSNPSSFGAPAGSNRTATISIDTTATTVATNITNICNPTYGTCAFANGGGTSLGTSATNSSQIINVSFNAAQLARVKDVMVGSTATSPIRFGIRVNFNATGLDGATINQSRTGSPTIINNAPYCSSIGISPASPLRTGTTNITVTARDDWGLNQINVGVSPAAGSLTSTDINTITGNPRLGATTVPWNVTNAPHGTYQLNATITDLDGRSVACNASSTVTGSNNPGGGTGTPPTIVVDKVSPTCTPGSFIITANAARTRLGFSVSASDPGNPSTGLSNIVIDVQKPGTTTWQATGLTRTINPAVTPYTYSVNNIDGDADGNAYNIDANPAGLYTFRATWTDKAGNPTSCTQTYDKGSRISGRIFLNTGSNGDQRRDYSSESTGTAFNPISRLNGGPIVSANWNITNNTNCSAPYPGTAAAGSDTGLCDAKFITNVEYASTSRPTLGIRFPALSSDGTAGKYRCISMRLFNTVNSSTTPVKTFTGPGITNVACSGGVCGCDVTLDPNQVFINSSATYTTTSTWPTHVEFDLAYNSDQIYGQVRNESASMVSGNTVKVGNLAAATVASGNYASPAPTPDNSAAYTKSGTSPTNTTVALNNSDQTKLCMYAAKRDFANPTANTARLNTATNFDSPTKIANIARNLSVPSGSGWTVGVAAENDSHNLCSVNVEVANGVMTPKYQNQVNFFLLPKVTVTGRIYYLNKDNLCGNPDTWDDAANQATGTIPVTISMSTSGTSNNNFYNPDGDANYNSGETYTFYANALPGNTWNTWNLQRSVGFGSSTVYTSCGNGTINVNSNIPNYPSGGSVITSDIAVYVREANDWWQTYNGGVHGLTGIQDAIPNESLPVEVGGFDMHTLIGVPNNSIYTTASSPALIKNGFTPSTSGALVTTKGSLSGINAGRNGSNWQISSDKAWKQDSMPALKIPFADSSSSTTVDAINKVKALSGSSAWSTSTPNFSTKSSNNKIVLTGNQTIGSSSSDITIGNNNYILVDGNVNINGNIKPSGNNLDQTVFIIARGDVTIAGNVTDLNAFIYTPGDINIQTAGQDSSNEKILKVYGGLYAGGTIHQRRDIENTPTNFGYPSAQIMFNPALIISTRGASFPSQLKDTNVYWTQQ